MSAKPHPTIKGLWEIDCRPNGYKGKRVRETYKCNNQEEADAIWRTLMRKPVGLTKPTAKMISAIWPQWISYYRANRAVSTVADAETCWQHLKLFFGRMQPKLLTRNLIETYKQNRISDGVKHRTVTKELSYLSSMLKWAASNDYCDPLPFQIVGFGKKLTTPAKPRPLSPEQVTAILEKIDGKYRLPFLLMADAGLRRSEALQLKREHVELQQGLIFVKGKGNKERIVPITTDRLMQELAQKRDCTGFLTVNRSTGRPYLAIRKALIRAAAEAGIDKHLYHHLLRHSFGTIATTAGYDVSALQAIMGHSSVQTTAIYQHLAGEYLRSQGRKMNSMVADLACPDGQSENDLQNNDI